MERKKAWAAGRSTPLSAGGSGRYAAGCSLATAQSQASRWGLCGGAERLGGSGSLGSWIKTSRVGVADLLTRSRREKLCPVP